jgi:hypothetical protein
MQFIYCSDIYLGKTYRNSPAKKFRYEDFFCNFAQIVDAAVAQQEEINAKQATAGAVADHRCAAFFDGPTSNLDATRRENLAHVFQAIDVGREEVTEHWYDQLFLIGHDVAFTKVTDQIISLDI